MIHVTYQDEDYSNNIHADNFQVEYTSQMNRIHISLGPSLNQRNKSSNSLYDANELIRKASKLSLVQIDEDQIIKGLLNALKKYPENSWELQLNSKGMDVFRFKVILSIQMGSIFLDVTEYIEQ